MMLLKLLLAHFIGDFVLQSSSWVADKERRKWSSPKLYIHVAIHLALYALFLWDFSYWYVQLIIAGLHLVIDGLKLSFQNQQNKRWLFFVDQLAHLAVIVVVCWLSGMIAIDFSISNQAWLFIFGGLFLTSPTSIMIKMLISVYKPHTELEDDDSLDNAGKYIGMLERLLIFVFIVSGHWEGVGFLIAAKSIFRFSDLTQSKDRKLTEYILIGTLLSFGIAILIAILIPNGL